MPARRFGGGSRCWRKLSWNAGDPDCLTFTRSTLKPFQALPLVEAGGLTQFGSTEAETALLGVSHSGEPMHLAVVESMPGKTGRPVRYGRRSDFRKRGVRVQCIGMCSPPAPAFMSPTTTDTSTLPAFSNCSVIGNLSPAFSGAFNPCSIKW